MWAKSIQLVTKALAGRSTGNRVCRRSFHLASYMIEGGPSKTFLKTKRLMYSNETMWRRLVGKLVDVLGDFAGIQVRCRSAGHSGV